jgi:fatty-acyl-CoA synthase
MFILELNHPNFRKYNTSTLRTGIVTGAPCPVELVKRIRNEMNCNICVSYGATETSGCLTFTGFDAPDILRAETVGQPVEGIEIKIVDNERRTLPIGEPGELACRTQGLMKGYVGSPEVTAEVIDSEGWFYTGDLATMDEQGYVRIVGRKKEMIIRGGFKIYPREVEEVLCTHPAVQMAAVVGLPDPILGEINCACIKLNEGFQVTDDEIIEFCKDKMIYYKLPNRVMFREDFPMTASGKIKKVALREALISGGAA